MIDYPIKIIDISPFKFCKHIENLLILMDKEKATDMLRKVYSQKEA